jgi:Na+/H+ antiporter NhaC
VLPLQVASLLGLAMAGFGLLILAYVVGRYLIQGSPVPGFPFLASVIALFSGAQLLSLGIMGEYLWRMYFRVMDQPPYVVRARLESGVSNEPTDV